MPVNLALAFFSSALCISSPVGVLISRIILLLLYGHPLGILCCEGHSRLCGDVSDATSPRVTQDDPTHLWPSPGQRSTPPPRSQSSVRHPSAGPSAHAALCRSGLCPEREGTGHSERWRRASGTEPAGAPQSELFWYRDRSSRAQLTTSQSGIL